MKRKGFTLVELLVVIAIIALLMGILMPALARVRQLAFRMTCGTNLSGIGKAMLIYANDYEDELPRAGGRASTWGNAVQWDAPDRYRAYGLAADGSSGQATISSCFYLLVKYSEVTPKSFVCKADAGTNEFKLSDITGLNTNFELIDAWDFGPVADSRKHCSYAYHMPFGLYALTTSSEPGFAVAADRNPFIISPAAAAADLNLFKPDIAPWNGTTDDAKAGNAIAHQSEGQSVLFLDNHVEFAKRAYCSMEDDNIYLISPNTNKGSPTGSVPVPNTNPQPNSRKDSLLIHDPDAWGPKGRTCFAAQTPAWIGGHLVPIARAAVGQSVGAVAAGPMAAGAPLNHIERVDAHPGVFREAYTLILENGEALCVVGSHLFLRDSGAWARVENLRPGDMLSTHGTPVRVWAAVRHTQPYVGTVYNLKIKDSDHYFVGRAGVVVRDY